MNTKGEQFAGLTVALVTPFRNGEVDFDELNRLVDWQIEQGTDCLSPVGTTGESPTLDHEEHERVMGAVVERARGAAPARSRHAWECDLPRCRIFWFLAGAERRARSAWHRR